MEQSGGVVVGGVLCFSLSFSIIDLKSVLSIILDVRGENREDPDLWSSLFGAGLEVPGWVSGVGRRDFLWCEVMSSGGWLSGRDIVGRGGFFM